MSDPVVTGELQAGQGENPKRLPSLDIRVRPSTEIKEVFDHGESPQGMCPLLCKVALHKCRRANRDVADCQSNAFISICVSD
jgi:hypothetical protein